MMQVSSHDPVDYLLVGHLTVDLTSEGPQIGGTVAYSALTALSMGLKVGIVTAWGGELPSEPFAEIPIVGPPAEKSTTFENIYTDRGRYQKIHHVAQILDHTYIPEAWRQADIVHLGPVAQEVDASLVRYFPSSLMCVTPQGWLRNWNAEGDVINIGWSLSSYEIKNIGALVIGIEDIQYNEELLEEIVVSCPVVAVTEGAEGVRLYWNGDVRRFHPPDVDEVDATGAGDIFATAFFIRLYTTRDPWEAARFATLVSSRSVTRRWLNSVPTESEIKDCTVEVL